MKKSVSTISIVAILFSFLVSCSANPVVDTLKSNLWINAFSRLIYGYPDYPISRELVESIPYASLRVKIGKGPAGLMILQKKEDNIYSWVSKDSVLFKIKGGRIIRTSGLNNDLIEYYYNKDIPFEFLIDNNLNKTTPFENKNYTAGDGATLDYILNLLDCPASETFNCRKEILEGTTNIPTKSRKISLSNPEVRGMDVIVKTVNMGNTSIDILDKKYEVAFVKEVVTNKKIGWKHENLFWVDRKSGKVRKSIQQIAPNVPPILIEVTKMPSR